MLRWMMPLMAGLVAIGSAAAADLAGSGPARYRKAPPVHGRAVPLEEESDVLFTPSEGSFPVLLAPRTPILPGSATLPGYYGSNHSYTDLGPYYGGPYTSYWNRLPYACGVYGYC